MDRPINAEPPPPPPPAWSPFQRVLFRFFFAYLLLFVFFVPNALGISILYNFYSRPFHRLIPWVALHVLHLSRPATLHATGSGDTAYNYVGYLLLLVMALATCLIWTILDRRRPSYRVASYWLTTIVRYYLAITMLSYGYAKVFKVQMPFPDLMRLLEPYGDSTPFALAWTFMGYSFGYSIFMGLAEVLAGALLLFRRTTAIGAFISFVVSANIVAINYSFDVPVKLLSTTMVVMSLFLLGGNIPRLWALFFQARTIRLNIVPRPPVRKKSARVVTGLVKFVLIAWFITMPAYRYAWILAHYGDHAPRTALRGIYNVRAFVWNKDTLSPLQTDSIRWQQLIVDGIPGNASAAIKLMNDSVQRYKTKIDTTFHSMDITDPGDSGRSWQLSYAETTGDSLELWGKQLRGNAADSIRVTLVRYPLSRFPLNFRGFNWVNEYPYNR